MPRSITKIRIFIASPGDTSEERNLTSEIIDDLNKIQNLDNIEFELIKWETHSYPGIGVDAQDVINNQIRDDYDIFVGLMWKRFGTPTNRSSSGTEEEFLRALEIYRTNQRPIKILFYFSQTAIPPKEIDVEQLQKINRFKDEIKRNGIYYWEYSTIKEFERFFRVQISKSAKELLDELKITPTSQANSDADVGVVNEYEPGLFDLIEQFTEDSSQIESVLGRMTDLMTELGEKMNKRAVEMNSVDMTTLKPQEIKKLIDKTANDMQIYVRRMNTEMPIFKEAMGNGFDALAKAYAIYYTDWKGSISEDEKEAFNKIEQMMESMNGFNTEMKSLRLQISSLPRATTNFNKAKKDTDKVIKSLITEVESALNQIIEIKRTREDSNRM